MDDLAFRAEQDEPEAPDPPSPAAPDPIHWIDPIALVPALPLAQEIYACLAAVAAVYVRWRPNEPQWQSVIWGAADQRKRLLVDEHRYSSTARPEDLNALYGHFESHPVHCAAIGISFVGENRAWVSLAALLLWPYVTPRVLGYQVAIPAPHHVRRLGQLLRDVVAGNVSKEILDLVWAAWSKLDGKAPPPIVRTHDKSGLLWNAIAAHIDVYRSTRILASADDNAEPAGETEELIRPAVELVIDQERMADPECEGLSPEDANARSFRIASQGPEDDGTDPLARFFGNFHAEERSNQHLALAWNRLAPPERTLLREGLAGLDSQAQCGTALSILLSISPEQAASLELHGNFETAANAAVADGKWHLGPTDNGSIVAVHGVQRAPSAYRRGGSKPGWLESANFSVVGLPAFVTDALAAPSQGATGHVLRFLPEIAQATRTGMEALRRKSSARLTFGRVRELLADELFSSLLISTQN